MATLNQILQYTMFAQAGQGLSFDNIGVEPFPKPTMPAGHVYDYVAAVMPIWHFDHNGSEPAKIRNLTCIARGMRNSRMTVCDEISVEDAKIVTSSGQEIDLQLSSGYVLRRSYLKRGQIRQNQHLLYPLQAETCRSMLTVFGYEFASETTDPTPIPEAALESNAFMPFPGDESRIPSVGPGQTLTLVTAPLRVLVCISFVTGKERSDFEPGGILGAGRVWPHVMIIANRPLASTHATIHVKRPTQMRMEVNDDKAHQAHAEMNPAIEASFFADNNRRVLLLNVPFSVEVLGNIPIANNPSPYWDDLFDSYDVGVSRGTIRAVDPFEAGGEIAGAIEDLGLLGYSSRTIDRVARQGAYDNVHVAPTMRSSAVTPASDQPNNPNHHLDKIYMAPFCEHDCLHTHWRWARWHSVQSVFGWSSEALDKRVPGRPYATPGATMVPRNQFVDIESTGLSSFKYIAHAVGEMPHGSSLIPAGTWSIFFHHGMAYSISLSSALVPMLDATIDSLAVAADGPMLNQTAVMHSAIRYWRLRWGGRNKFPYPNVVLERLKTLDRTKILGRVPTTPPPSTTSPTKPNGPDAGASP